MQKILFSDNMVDMMETSDTRPNESMSYKEKDLGTSLKDDLSGFIETQRNKALVEFQGKFAEIIANVDKERDKALSEYKKHLENISEAQVKEIDLNVNSLELQAEQILRDKIAAIKKEIELKIKSLINIK